MTGKEERARIDERRLMADLITEHCETIAEFAADKERTVLLIALLLRMGELPQSVAALAATRADASR